MKKFLPFFFLPFALFGSLPDHVVEKTGMFGIVNCVLSVLFAYEKGRVDQIDIDFGEKGLFYEPELGPNWWEYYFAPIHINRTTDKSRPLRLGGRDVRRNNELLASKYIKIKPELEKKITAYAKQNFANHFILGVHYRGTDKKLESPRVPYERFNHQIKRIIAQFKNKPYKIFIATDEAPFIEYMRKNYGNHIIYYPSTIRSKDQNPIHYSERNHCRLGEEAVIDCYLLSRCNYLLRTQSNLSAFSTFINSQLPAQIVR